jgi:starch phosphorylase
MFLFGLTAEEVQAARRAGYDPLGVYYTERPLRAALDAVAGGVFSPEDPGRFRPVVDALLYGGDPYMVLADFLSYSSCQRTVEAAYRDQASWARKAILNVANMGRFSSDNTILRYANEIWGVVAPNAVPSLTPPPPGVE